MSAPIYSTTVNIHMTREQARDFTLVDPENFVDFVMAYNTDAVIDYIKSDPKLLRKFILDGGLSEEDD